MYFSVCLFIWNRKKHTVEIVKSVVKSNRGPCAVVETRFCGQQVVRWDLILFYCWVSTSGWWLHHNLYPLLATQVEYNGASHIQTNGLFKTSAPRRAAPRSNFTPLGKATFTIRLCDRRSGWNMNIWTDRWKHTGKETDMYTYIQHTNTDHKT